MDGIYNQQYNISSYDQSSNTEPGTTFGEYLSTDPNLGTIDNQTFENYGELGNLDSYKNNAVIKLSPVTIGAYPTSSSFSNNDLNGIEPISSTSNYDDYTNANTFQDTDININTNTYDNNGTYTNLEPTVSTLYNEYDSTTTTNNIDYQMDSNINGNDFPIVSNNNIISSDNFQWSGSDGQYNELFNGQELVSSQNEENNDYLSNYRNGITITNNLDENFNNYTLGSNDNNYEGQYVDSYQQDYNSKTWTDIPSSNNNAYESQNFNIDSNEQIPLYNLNTSFTTNDYKYESENYHTETNYNNTINYVDSNDNLGEIYPSTGKIKSYSVHSQPIYTKPTHTSITLPPKVMFPKDEIDYVPVKKTQYIKKTKTKVFIPTKKTIVIPKIKKVIIPKKQIIYVNSPNNYSNSMTVLPPRVSTRFVQNAYTSPIRYNYQRNDIIYTSPINNVTSTPMPPVSYNITSIPVATNPAGSYVYSSPIKSYNTPSIPVTTYKIESIPVTTYNNTTSFPATTYKVDSIPVTNYNVTSIPTNNYNVTSIPVNSYNANSSNIYNVEPTPVTNYNVTSIPSNSYNITSYPTNNYNDVSIPQNSYSIASIPKYNITSIPVSSYNVTTYKNYITPSIPENTYKVDSIRASNYNVTSFPSNNYNITSIPKYNVTSIPLVSTPARKYSVASNHYSTYSVGSYNAGSNPVSPLRASREIEVSRVVTPLRRSLYRNKIYHVDSLSSRRHYHHRRI
jgi:hypothetical protein